MLRSFLKIENNQEFLAKIVAVLENDREFLDAGFEHLNLDLMVFS